LSSQTVVAWVADIHNIKYGQSFAGIRQSAKGSKNFYSNEAGWYTMAQDRQEWCRVCERGLLVSQAGFIVVDLWTKQTGVIDYIK